MTAIDVANVGVLMDMAKTIGKYAFFLMLWWAGVYFLFSLILFVLLITNSASVTGTGLADEYAKIFVNAGEISIGGVLGSFFYGIRKTRTGNDGPENQNIPGRIWMYIDIGKYAGILATILSIGAWLYVVLGYGGDEFNFVRITGIFTGIAGAVLTYGVHKKSLTSALLLFGTYTLDWYESLQRSIEGSINGSIDSSMGMGLALHALLGTCFVLSIYGIVKYKNLTTYASNSTEKRKSKSDEVTVEIDQITAKTA